MVRIFILIVGVLLGPSQATAADMAPIKDRALFLDYLDGRDIGIRLYGLTISITADGRLDGRAVGRAIKGTWSWEDGFFCREMTWGTRQIPYNCQLIQARGKTMRFTTDKGHGDSADFGLR